MNRRITLCWEHIVTIRFTNYKCILMHNKETHYETSDHTMFLLLLLFLLMALESVLKNTLFTQEENFTSR
jgi:hypothetical protein